MAKEANFGFLAILSGGRPFSLPCSGALFLQTCSLAADMVLAGGRKPSLAQSAS